MISPRGDCLADSVTLVAVEANDTCELRDLAGRIWREHYPGIISPDQIEFMLSARFSDQVIGRVLSAD